MREVEGVEGGVENSAEKSHYRLSLVLIAGLVLDRRR